MSKFVKDSQGNYKDSDGFELINQFDGTFQVLDQNGDDISGEYETLKQAKQTVKDYKFFNKETISGTMTRFKKGSKEAKAFMAKLRSRKKGAKKKKKVSGLKITPKPNVESRLQFGKRGITVKPIKRKSTSKKKKISGNTHTDTKSHNYRINISGLKSEYMEVSQKLDLFALDIALLKKQARETKGKYNKKALNDTARDMQKKYIALKRYQKTLI